MLRTDRSRVAPFFVFFFCFNCTATTEIYPLSLHDALPIFPAHILWKRCGWTAQNLMHGSASMERRAAAPRKEMEGKTNRVGCPVAVERICLP